MNSVCSLRKQLVRITVSVSLAVLFLLQTGCNFGTDFTYGKSADLSVNGTSVSPICCASEAIPFRENDD